MKKDIKGHPYVSYSKKTYSEKKVIRKSADFFKMMDMRRTVRDFSNHDIPRKVVENIIKTASTAPSGAHKQPWTFCVVSDPKIKKKIRKAAEEEEKKSYDSRMSEDWLKDLQPLGTNWHKPFLEVAPYLIIVFRKSFDIDESGKKANNYYVSESVGLACGFLLAAIHNAGLVALTHTPSPMNFLTKILKRPKNERPYLLIPIGYPAKKTWVPDLNRKELKDVAMFY